MGRPCNEPGIAVNGQKLKIDDKFTGETHSCVVHIYFGCTAKTAKIIDHCDKKDIKGICKAERNRKECKDNSY